MFDSNAVRDREPEPCAFWLGCHVRLENSLGVCGAKSRAVVADREEQFAARGMLLE